MITENESNRGAPAGNQNARKHGFYSPKLDAAQQQDYEDAVTCEGLDEEIALMRVKIKAVVEKDPDNLNLILRASDSLARLIRIKYNIGKDDKTSMKEAMRNVLKDIALPIGIGFGVGKSMLK